MTTDYLDFDRGADIVSLITLCSCAIAGFVLGWIVKVKDEKKGTEERSVLGGIEAVVLAILGGLIARFFIWVLLIPLAKGGSGHVVVGHLFFLIPAVVDDFIALGGDRVLLAPDGLLMLATIVGAFSGMMDGIWRIHPWKGLGWLSFPLDATWGLAGQNYGMLLHIVNFAWGDHGSETRRNAHRYQSGFRLKSTYAFTQGSVMSNLSDAPGTPLYRHERTHVWQNRVFGPFFSLTYIGWMLFWLIPGHIAGAIKKTAAGKRVGVGNGIERWCYYNCPWETWAYAVQGVDRKKSYGPELVWKALPVIIAAVPICGGVTALCVALYSASL